MILLETGIAPLTWAKLGAHAPKIPDFHPHDWRHTWATWHCQENRDLNMLMHLGGWSSLSMVLRYAHVNVAHTAPSIRAMPSIGPAKAPAANKAKPAKAAPSKAKGKRSTAE